jgi:hypothetical protein
VFTHAGIYMSHERCRGRGSHVGALVVVRVRERK